MVSINRNEDLTSTNDDFAIEDEDFSNMDEDSSNQKTGMSAPCRFDPCFIEHAKHVTQLLTMFNPMLKSHGSYSKL